MADKLIPDFYAGDTVHIDIEVKFDGVPEDLTGATLYFTAKAVETDPDNSAAIRVQVTVPTGASASAGKARITLPSDQTDVAPGPYVCDLRRVKPGTPPDVWTVVKQKVKVLKPVRDEV